MEIGISEYIASHVFHEISGCVTAMNCNVSLLSYGDVDKEKIGLVQEANQQVVAQLKFLRHFYGYFADTQEHDPRELVLLAQNILKDTKISLEAEYVNDEELKLSNHLGKILLGLINSAATNVPYGGKIRVVFSKETGKLSFLINCSASKLKERNTINNILIDEENKEAISSRNVPAYYTLLLAKKYNYNIIVDLAANFINYQAKEIK